MLAFDISRRNWANVQSWCMSIGCKWPKPSAMRRCCIWKQPHRPGCSWKRNGEPRGPFPALHLPLLGDSGARESKRRLFRAGGREDTAIEPPFADRSWATFALQVQLLPLGFGQFPLPPRSLSGLSLRTAGFCSGPYRARNHGRHLRAGMGAKIVLPGR